MVLNLQEKRERHYKGLGISNLAHFVSLLHKTLGFLSQFGCRLLKRKGKAEAKIKRKGSGMSVYAKLLPLESGPLGREQDLEQRAALKKAEEEGYVISYPEDDELQLDIDSARAMEVFEKQREILEKYFPFKEVFITPSERSGHYHVRVKLDREIRGWERVALQACLGSDLRRELLSGIRLMTFTPDSILLFERPGWDTGRGDPLLEQELIKGLVWDAEDKTRMRLLRYDPENPKNAQEAHYLKMCKCGHPEFWHSGSYTFPNAENRNCCKRPCGCEWFEEKKSEIASEQ